MISSTTQQLYCISNLSIKQMNQVDQSIHKNIALQLSQRQSAKRSSRLQKNQSNPQATIQSNSHQYQTQLVPKLEREPQKTSSKILLKQKDRYQNRIIEKGMFNKQQESVSQLKIIYSNSNSNVQLKKDQSNSSISKRKPLRLSPIKNSSGVQLLSQKQLNRNSEIFQAPKKLPQRVAALLPIRVKQIANFHEFVKQAMPVSKKLVGVLRRNRAGAKRLYPQLSVFMNQQLKYLLNSKRKSCHLNSTYHMGTNPEIVEQGDRQYVGTLKSNFLGSQFNFYDNSNNQTQLLATITFVNQLTCKSVPRQIQVFVLSPFYKFSDLEGADTTNAHLNLKILYDLGENKQNRKILKFINKKPTWDQARQVYCMDFHGKAQYSSVKNMILVDAENQSKQVFLIAKADQDVFNFDVMFPLSPRIALAIACASFDWKWASQ